MRKLIAQQWFTVDNITAEKDGGLSFVGFRAQAESTQPHPRLGVHELHGHADLTLTQAMARTALAGVSA